MMTPRASDSHSAPAVVSGLHSAPVEDNDMCSGSPGPGPEDPQEAVDSPGVLLAARRTVQVDLRLGAGAE